MGSPKRRLYSPFQYSITVENSVSIQVLLHSSPTPKFAILTFAQGQLSLSHRSIMKTRLTFPSTCLFQNAPQPCVLWAFWFYCGLFLKYCWSLVLNPSLSLYLQEEWVETRLLSPHYLDLLASTNETPAPGKDNFRQNLKVGEIRVKALQHYFGFSLASPRGW